MVYTIHLWLWMVYSWVYLGFTMVLPWFYHIKRSIQLVGPEMSATELRVALSLYDTSLRILATASVTGFVYRVWEPCFDGNKHGGGKCANVWEQMLVNHGEFKVNLVSKTHLFESGFNDNFKVPSLGHTMWKHLCKWFGCACARIFLFKALSKNLSVAVLDCNILQIAVTTYDLWYCSCVKHNMQNHLDTFRPLGQFHGDTPQSTAVAILQWPW